MYLCVDIEDLFKEIKKLSTHKGTQSNGISVRFYNKM